MLYFIVLLFLKNAVYGYFWLYCIIYTNLVQYIYTSHTMSVRCISKMLVLKLPKDQLVYTMYDKSITNVCVL